MSPSVDKTQLLAGLVCDGTRKKQTAAMRWWNIKNDGSHAYLASSTSANKESTSVCPQLNSIPIIPGNWKAVLKGEESLRTIDSRLLCHHQSTRHYCWPAWCASAPERNKQPHMHWWIVTNDGNHACRASSTSANETSTSVCPQLNSIPIIPGNWKAVCQGQNPFAPLTHGFFVTISRQNTTAGRLGVCRHQKQTNKQPPCIGGLSKMMETMRT